MNYQEVETIAAFKKLLRRTSVLKQFAFQSLDFSKVQDLLHHVNFVNCIFLGCHIPESVLKYLPESNLIFPQLNLPYNSYINKLYNREILYEGYELGIPDSYEETFDHRVYTHYLSRGKEAHDIGETLARRLHDHSVTDALNDFLKTVEEKKVIAIMGGHSLSRTSEDYHIVTRLSKQLTEMGYLMVSGGGPGAMEATHLGAWLAGRSLGTIDAAIKLMSKAPCYEDKLWLDSAFEVLHTYPNSLYESIGIPTWHYGHEPATPFASRIAKYFANSVREEGLLTIAKGGVIFSPGSAGTVQEIFQDAAQNHYLSFGYASPMIFLNQKYWVEELPIYPLLKKLAEDEKYQNMLLSSCSDQNEVIKVLKNFHPG
ncbi:putative Rossmann-fold nucleotide-binding protein [Catalinimonas alkaloidigena]|uniref:LOG family protein n=1 Tax=Catalinimonas alkaloidigena TaxID=1075417 RepID=UPI002406245E|nr:hypothetical protein [Catalinimonas alkaloidigena]MDF9796082.1 putative Rossmann-fold nucleotide-binding protein [Catalinimonas alkaloidigena]